MIYLKSTFWINLIKEYNFPDWENISNCHKLRELYKNYNSLINNLYEDDPKKSVHKKNKDDIYSNIKSDINRYYERDEFAFLLNKNIKEFFEKNKNIFQMQRFLVQWKIVIHILVLRIKLIRKNIKIIEIHIFLII